MEAARAAPGGRRKNLSLKLAPRARRQKETFDAAFEGFYREHVAEVYQYALAVLAVPPGPSAARGPARARRRAGRARRREALARRAPECACEVALQSARRDRDARGRG